jgi:hypothetical protein
MEMVLGGKRGARRGSGDDVFCAVALVWGYFIGRLLNCRFLIASGLPL